LLASLTYFLLPGFNRQTGDYRTQSPSPRSHRIDDWESALIEPVLARLFDAPKVATTDPNETRDGATSCTPP
jgi:hypothetical protein